MPIASFSLSQSGTRIMSTIPRGRKSAFVDNAIHHWKQNRDLWNNKFTRSMLLETDISTLQNIAWQNYKRAEKLQEEIDEIARSREIADNEAKKVPPSRGIWGKLKFW